MQLKYENDSTVETNPFHNQTFYGMVNDDDGHKSFSTDNLAQLKYNIK